MGKEGVGLEYHREAAGGGRQGGDVPAGNDDTAGVGGLEPGDDAEEGRLPAAAGAEEDDEAARGDVD